MRSLYKGLREAEDRDEDLEDALLPVDVSEEITVIEAKLQEATEALDELVKGEDGGAIGFSKATRFRTATSHCNRRLQRLISHADVEQKKMVKPLFGSLKGPIEEFRKLGNAPVYAASSVPSVSSFTQENTKAESDAEDSDSEGEPKKERKSFKVPKDLHKWGIKFSGDDGSSVLSFLMDVEEKAAWKRVDLNSLLLGASEFFPGSAKTWFRSVRTKIDSWVELKIALRKEYLPLDYYDNLWDEIRSRKQGPTETMGTFVSNMLALFDRLEMSEPVNEDVMLRTMMKNLAPFYAEKLALLKVLSLNQLKEFGKKLEVSKFRVENFDGKTKPRKMEPEFAAKPDRSKKLFANEISVEALETPPSVDKTGGPKLDGSVPEGGSPTKPAHSKLKCWKCDSTGHRHSNCTSAA